MEKKEKEKKNEGRHYKKRDNKRNKKFYSLRALVPEITGIDENNNAFESAYQEVKRIIRMFRESLGIEGSEMRILEKDKDAYVDVLRNYFMNNTNKDIIKKINKENEKKVNKSVDKENKKKANEGKELSLKEIDASINIFKDALLKNALEDEKKKIQQFFRENMGDEYYQQGELIKKKVLEDILLVGEIKNYETKLQLLEDYKNILEDSLQIWRQNINLHINIEKAYERAVEKDPKLKLSEPLSHENMTHEIVLSIMKEFNLPDKWDENIDTTD